MADSLKDISNTTYHKGFRLISGLPLLIIMTLDGNTGIDLLDAIIMYVTSLAGTIG